MTPEEIIALCRKNIERFGPQTSITLSVRGKWGKNVNKQLWPGGPKGRIVSDDFAHPGFVIALFDAAPLAEAVAAKMREATHDRA